MRLKASKQRKWGSLLLLVTVAPTPFLSLVSGDFLALPFLSRSHTFHSLNLGNSFKNPPDGTEPQARP